MSLELCHDCSRDWWRPGRAVRAVGDATTRGCQRSSLVLLHAGPEPVSWGPGRPVSHPPLGASLGPGRARGGNTDPAVMRPGGGHCCCFLYLCLHEPRGCPLLLASGPLGCGRVGWSCAPEHAFLLTLRARCSPGARAGMDSWTTDPGGRAKAEAVRGCRVTHG